MTLLQFAQCHCWFSKNFIAAPIFGHLKNLAFYSVFAASCFAHFSTYSFHCTFIMISMKTYEEINKIIFFLLIVSMEMAAIFDFRALTKVHRTLKPLLQMQ